MRVVRVVQAFECGAIVNPAGLRSQVEGAIVQGLGGALFEAIEFDDGCIRTNGFSTYRVPRFADLPTIEIILLDRRDLPSAGGSETPIVGIAPARCATRLDLNQSLKGHADLNVRSRRFQGREVLVAVQVALCVVLLHASFLAVRGLQLWRVHRRQIRDLRQGARFSHCCIESFL